MALSGDRRAQTVAPLAWFCACLALFWVVAVSLSDGPSSPPDQPSSEFIDTALVAFEDLSSGAVRAYLPSTDATLSVYPSGDGSFLRGVLRSLVRERQSRGVSGEPIFELKRAVSGQLLIVDPLTNKWIALEAFGPDNRQVFALLLDRALNHRPAQRTEQMS